MTSVSGRVLGRGGVATSTPHRTNNLDALRLVGAVAVVVGHAFHLTGRPTYVPWMLGYGIQTLGVIIFFAISGYLITASWSRGRDLVGYTAARCLRIFPALIAVILVSIFVIGPLTTTLSTGDYFANSRTWSYLDNIIMRPQYDLPLVFADLPYANVVNGSLWTLPAEFFCYIVVPLALVVPKVLRVPVVSLLLGVALWLSMTPAPESAVIYGTRISDAAMMWVFFAAGALLRLGHERWRGMFRTDVAVGAMAAYVVALSLWPVHVGKVAWVALPYVVLTVGLASTPYVRRAARFGDLSYGIYVWAFPVQQLVVHVLGVQRMAVNLLLVMAFTLPLAWLSWHLVEQPSLRLKDRIGRRRVAAAGHDAPPVTGPATERPAAEALRN
jgi:peptidoglycan/LPS O-acetylase OafA/YrhL